MLLLVSLFALGSASARHIIDLDSGWEFVRIASQPTVWNGADAVPTSSWHVIHVSSEERSAEDARASNAFDGKPNTIWHTEWSRRQAPYPHEIDIDMGSSVSAIGLRLLPRQTGPQNGRPNHFQLFLSPDANRWGEPVLDDSVPDSSGLYEKHFAPVQGRYLRLVVKDGYRSKEPFLALAEIGLVRQVNLDKKTDWQSQYNIAYAQTGDKRFDLGKNELSLLKEAELKSVGTNQWISSTLPQPAWIRPLNKPEIWQGVAYYRRHLKAPLAWRNKQIEFTVAAMQSSDVWLNGRLVASRRGGYMPLRADFTGILKSENDLLIRVDNSDNPLIPPGKPQQDLDFMYGNGLYSDARLTVTDKLHVTDALSEGTPFGGGIYVTYPVVGKGHAVIRVRTQVRNADLLARHFVVSQRLLNDRGEVAASDDEPVRLTKGKETRTSQDISISKPRLWSPDQPNLYRLETSIVENGTRIDSVITSIGIRKIEVSRQSGFVINGEPLRLVGTNHHQDYPWVGPALSSAACFRDALLIKRSGHNIVRLSHYPQTPAFLDACDKFGILTIPCIPGWQFMNKDARFNERVRRDIQELIRRDRNHPSVAFWEASLNETYPPAAIARNWYDAAKSEELDGNLLLAGDGTIGAPWDVIYNQWKEDLSRPQDAIPAKPGYVREYGDYEFGGAYSSSRVKIGAGFDKLLQETWNHVWSYNLFRPQYPWTMGVGTWEMFDHNVPWEFSVSASGLADLMRREKPSFWFYESQAIGRPFLKVASNWDAGPPLRTIVVFTNSDLAVLRINGNRVAVARAAGGKETGYIVAKPFDGSNTDHLPHPPIIFRNVPYQPGELRVTGFANGKAVATQSIWTSGKPLRLKVWLDDLGVPATPNDEVFIRAAIVDAKGVICTNQSKQIRFSVHGGYIAGESKSMTEMGVASILVRTPIDLGTIEVRATAPDLESGICSFTFKRQ